MGEDKVTLQEKNITLKRNVTLHEENALLKHNVTLHERFPSMNEFILANRTGKGRWNKGNTMKHRDQRIISGYICEQMHKVHINQPVFIRYRFYEPNKKRDLDNISGYFHKVFQDALVDCGVLHNDSWQYIVGFSDEFYIDNKDVRVEVEIVEMGDSHERFNNNITDSKGDIRKERKSKKQ